MTSSPPANPFPPLQVIGFALLLSAVAMIMPAAALIIKAPRQSFWHKYGIGYLTLSILMLVLGAAVLLHELSISRNPNRAEPVDTRLRDLLSRSLCARRHRASRRGGDMELKDLESGLADWGGGPVRTGSGRETVGHPYPYPRLQLTATGMPSSMVCDMAATASRTAYVHRAQRRPSDSLSGPPRARAHAHAADTPFPQRRATATRATQTAMRNIRGPRAAERLPGGMAPMTFWWLLLEEQRREAMAREPETGRRFSV